MNKQERLAKESQIKSLIQSAMEYFYPEELLDILDDICDSDQSDDLKEKCKDLLTIDGGVFVCRTDLVSEVELKEFCKGRGIKIVDYSGNL